MKLLFLNTIFLSLLTAFSIANGQSLTYSRVLNISAVEDTVPPGKVWKLESYWQGNVVITSSTAQGTCGCTSCHHPFYIDGIVFYKFDGISTGGGSLMGQGNTFPLWLAAGKRIKTDCSDDFLSVIEFIETP